MKVSSNTMGFLSIIFACLCWASDSYFRFPLMEKGVSAARLVYIEHSILVLFFSTYIFTGLRTAFKQFDWKIWLSFIVVGAMGSAMATIYFSQAMNYLNPTVVILMQKLQPIFALIFARIILKEKLSKSFLGLTAFAMIGALMISYPDWQKMMQQGSSWFNQDAKHTFMGYFLTMLSVIIWAAASMFGKQIFNSTQAYFSVPQVLAIRYLLGWVTLALYFFVTDFFHSDIALHQQVSQNFVPIFFMVFISAILGMGLYYHGVKLLRPRNIVVAELWYPFMAILINKVLLGISLNPIQILGAVILVAATFSVQNSGQSHG